ALSSLASVAGSGRDRRRSAIVLSAEDADAGIDVAHVREATAAASGKTRRSIERAAARGEAIDPENLMTLVGTSLDKGAEMDALARTNPPSSKAHDRPDFQGGQRHARRFARKGRADPRSLPITLIPVTGLHPFSTENGDGGRRRHVGLRRKYCPSAGRSTDRTHLVSHRRGACPRILPRGGSGVSRAPKDSGLPTRAHSGRQFVLADSRGIQ